MPKPNSDMHYIYPAHLKDSSSPVAVTAQFTVTPASPEVGPCGHTPMAPRAVSALIEPEPVVSSVVRQGLFKKSDVSQAPTSLSQAESPYKL